MPGEGKRGVLEFVLEGEEEEVGDFSVSGLGERREEVEGRWGSVKKAELDRSGRLRGVGFIGRKQTPERLLEKGQAASRRLSNEGK